MKSPSALLPLALAALLAACSSQQEREPEPPQPVEKPVVAPSDPADRLLARAAHSPAGEAATLRLEAATLLLSRGETARALDAIAPIDATRLGSAERARHAWVLARGDLAAARPALALERLADPAVQAGAGTDRGLQVDVARARAEALLATGQGMESARERAALQPWLATDAERESNTHSLLEALAQAPLGALEIAASAAATEDWRAWLELSLALRDLRLSPSAQRTRLQQWSARYSSLAALETATRTVGLELGARIVNPARVAVLLPLSGRAGPSGQAVLQGYLAERYRQSQSGDPPPPVAVIDTTGESGGFAAAYGRAIADGATLVIGPLLKEDLAAFGNGLDAKVPTLALNFLEQPLPAQPRLTLFGIDPGDEVAQLAASARQAGLARLMILSDGTERARRLADTFHREWSAGGGTSLGTLHLGDINEYRGSLEQSLLLEQSAARRKELEQVLGMPVIADPRRRADLDLFVLFADPAAARSIRSLLTYLYAGDVPLWGTSLSNSGASTAAGNLDLEGLRFLDMPWFGPREASLRTESAGAVPAGPMERLVALGADAARLQSRVGVLEWLPDAGLAGASGALSRDTTGRLRRTSDWYRVASGRIESEQPGAAEPPGTTIDSMDGEHAWTPGNSVAPPLPDAPPNSGP